MPNVTADLDDLAAAKRFLAAEARVAATFGRIEEAVAPLLRAKWATGRITYATDPERGAILGRAFLKPLYAPSAEAERYVAWGIRFPDGGRGWDGADPPLPRVAHAVVALGAEGDGMRRPPAEALARLPRGWSALDGDAGFLPRSRSTNFPPSPTRRRRRWRRGRSPVWKSSGRCCPTSPLGEGVEVDRRRA